MFSDHFQPIDKLPAKKVFLVAAALVFVCQLVALVLVADGQVEKAQSRQAGQVSFQSAVAACVENSHGAALKNCARLVPLDSVQVRAEPTPPSLKSDAQGLMLVRLADQP